MLLQQVLEELSTGLAYPNATWPIDHEEDLAAEDLDEVIKEPIDIKKEVKKKKSSTNNDSRGTARRWVSVLRPPLAAQKLAARGPYFHEPPAAQGNAAGGVTSYTAEKPVARGAIPCMATIPCKPLAMQESAPACVPLAAHKHEARGTVPCAPLSSQDPTATTQEPDIDKHQLNSKEQRGSFNKGKVLQKKTSGPLTRNTNTSNSQCLHRAAIVARDIQVSNHGRLSAPALLANCLLSMISLADDDDGGDDVHQITNHRHSSASFYHHNYMHKDTSQVNHRDVHKISHHRSSSAHGSLYKEHHIHEIIHHRPSSATQYHDDHDVHEIIHHRHSSAAYYHDDHNKHIHDHDVHEISHPARTSSAAAGDNDYSNTHMHQKSTANEQESKASEPATPNDKPRSASQREHATRRNHKRETISCCLLGCGKNHSSKSMGSTLELLDNNSTSLDGCAPHLHKTNSSNGIEIQDHQSRAMWGSCDLRRILKRALLCNIVAERDDPHICGLNKVDPRRGRAAAESSKAALNDLHGCHIDKDDWQGGGVAAGSSKTAVKDDDWATNASHGGAGAAAGGSAGMIKTDDQLGYRRGMVAQGVIASHDVTVAATFVFSSSSTSSSTSSHSMKILQESAAHPWLAAHSPSPGLALLPPTSTSARHSSDHVPHEFDLPSGHDIINDHALLVTQDDLHLGLPNKGLNTHRS